MAYETQPGTLPHRVVQFLKAHPGEEFSTVLLCEEMGLDAYQVGSFGTWMAPARKHGAVKAQPREGAGRMLFWSLGDGKPEAEEQDEPDPLPVRRKVVAVSSPKPAPKPPEPPAAPIVTVLPEPKPAEVIPFNACRYIDGSVVVVGVKVRDDGAIIFKPDQARWLWALGAAA